MFHRNMLYKNSGKNSDEMRKQRANKHVELRKVKRDEYLYKIRNAEPFDVDNDQDDLFFDKSSISNLVSQDPEIRFKATKTLRRILSTANPPIDEVLELGVIPILVDYLSNNLYPHIQFEAVWVLINITASKSEHTFAVVEAGAVPPLISLLQSLDNEIRAQSAWVLANIIGDGWELRDYVIRFGVVPSLLTSITTNSTIDYLTSASWMIANLCRNRKEPLDCKIILELLPLIRNFIQSEDSNVKFNSLWSLVYLSQSSPNNIQMIAKADIVEFLIPLLSNPESRISVQALKIIGYVIREVVDQIRHIIDLNILHHINQISHNSKIILINEAMNVLTQIACSNQEHIQALLNSRSIPWVIQIILSTRDIQIQTKASSFITNLINYGSPQQLQYLIQSEIIKPFCGLLSTENSTIIINVLSSLLTILKSPMEETGMACKLLEECGGLDLIDELQYHENIEIHNLSSKIINDCVDFNEGFNEMMY